MSHFCVAVIAKNNNFKEVEELLKKYDENLEVEPKDKLPTYEEFIENSEKHLNKLSKDLDKIKQYLEND